MEGTHYAPQVPGFLQPLLHLQVGLPIQIHGLYVADTLRVGGAQEHKVCREELPVCDLHSEFMATNPAALGVNLDARLSAPLQGHSWSVQYHGSLPSQLEICSFSTQKQENCLSGSSKVIIT